MNGWLCFGISFWCACVCVWYVACVEGWCVCVFCLCLRMIDREERKQEEEVTQYLSRCGRPDRQSGPVVTHSMAAYAAPWPRMRMRQHAGRW